MPRVVSHHSAKADNSYVGVSFQDFYAIHAALQSFDHIPDIHLQIIDFLANQDQWNKGEAVLQCFRNAAKSSIAAVWIVWMLTQNPQLLFLIQSADNDTAKKMITDCQRIIATHPMAKHLFDPRARNTANGFRVRGSNSGRNLSVAARGIFSNVTGSRADIIVYDDVEVPKNARSEELRRKLRDRIAESSHLLNPESRRLFIGTPHSWQSIYPELIDNGASSLRIPSLYDLQGDFPEFTGTPSWPERWPLQKILAKQRSCTGKAEFLSQYQLMAVSPEDSYLNSGLLKVYDEQLRFVEANKSKAYYLGDKRVTSLVACWDPALSKASRDASVISVGFADEHGNVYLHRVVEMIGEVEQQCQQARDLLVELAVPIIHIETNGVGAVFPQILLKFIRGLGIAVNGEAVYVNKSERIQQAFETPLSAGILYIHRSVQDTKLITQINDFHPHTSKGHDDYLDVCAAAISKMPISVGRGINNELEGFAPYRQFSQMFEMPALEPEF